MCGGVGSRLCGWLCVWGVGCRLCGWLLLGGGADADSVVGWLVGWGGVGSRLWLVGGQGALLLGTTSSGL